MRFIDPNKSKTGKHIDYLEYMIAYCSKEAKHTNLNYFKKQLEVAKKKLKSDLKHFKEKCLSNKD